ncbi:hypothetical protein K2173_012254 [Erythroxylum novogranatense]|uniref:Nodulation signaling pathway 2-like protein n=1 Tax=Erythroxylum novogranatense TaxID=1862640 RepID=A0AAV8SCE2_9ROSI|nr:hypothetical protein K2173_012254 [Erythroxylum novogranatense]
MARSSLAEMCTLEFSSPCEENLPEAYNLQSLQGYQEKQFMPAGKGIDLTFEYDMDRYDQLMVDEIEDACKWMSDDKRSPPLTELLADARSLNETPEFTEASVGTDDSQLSMFHMLKAYGEAMDMEQLELAEQILRWLKEKANAVGSILERLAGYLIQSFEVNYLRQEASKNYSAAFQAFYQILPYGRFAHFTANSAIMESIPRDADVVHIVDFDIGNGVQWPPVLELLAKRGQRLVKLTIVKWQEDNGSFVPRLLNEHAKASDMRLIIKEAELEDLVSVAEKLKHRGRNEWLIFNCMVGLPHMGKGRPSKQVVQFLKIAKKSINLLRGHSCANTWGSRGIIILGDGIGVWSDCSEFRSSFDGMLTKFQALLKSIESYLPYHLVEARIALECLFFKPYISALSDLQYRKETIRESRALSDLGLKPWKLSYDTILEAKGILRLEGKSLLSVTVEEVKSQLVLSYMGTALIGVSCWR